LPRENLSVLFGIQILDIAEPEDAQYILDHTDGIAGFFGASSIERLAVEPAISGQARRFKNLRPRR